MSRAKILTIAVALGMASLAGAYAAVEILAARPPAACCAGEDTAVFEVPKGASLRRAGALLAAKGLIRSELVWRLYLKLHPGAPSPKAGKHEIPPGSNIPNILIALSQTPLSEDVPLTMVEGWRLRDADAALHAEGLIEPGAYQSAAERLQDFKIPFELTTPNLEGFLFPETYMIPPGPLDVHRLIQRQIDAFASRFFTPHQNDVRNSGRSLLAIVTMASMLEREEPKPALRPKVAGILFKRLDADWALGVDATSRYPLSDWNNRRVFLRALRDPEEPYNTRLKTGLPPGPIGAPSLASLEAALNPVKSKHWYYLHDAQQNIHFAKSAAGHEANRRRYNVW